MDTLPATATTAGPSTEVSTPAAYEDDVRHGHFAVTASSQIPKPTSSMSPLPVTASSPDITLKDAKHIGTRLHDDGHEIELPSPRLRSSRLFKGKGKEAVAIEKPRKKPLKLLDLPLDILKDIVRR